MGRFLELAYVKNKRIIESKGGANLFPEHLDDPQKTLSLRRVRVAGILIGL